MLELIREAAKNYQLVQLDTGRIVKLISVNVAGDRIRIKTRKGTYYHVKPINIIRIFPLEKRNDAVSSG